MALTDATNVFLDREKCLVALANEGKESALPADDRHWMRSIRQVQEEASWRDARAEPLPRVQGRAAP